MREQAQARLMREWREDLPAILDGVDTRPYHQGWALGERLEDEIVWDAARHPIRKTMQEVMRVVCHITGRAPTDIRSAKRQKPLAKHRHMVIMLIDRLCPHRTLSEIGQFLERDHTTILHALRNFPNTLAADPDLALEYDQCCRHFGIKP